MIKGLNLVQREDNASGDSQTFFFFTQAELWAQTLGSSRAPSGRHNGEVTLTMPPFAAFIHFLPAC
jgi:hypothetical protein